MRALIALLCGIALSVQAETFSAKVIMVMDGDTVMVLRGNQKIKVRMANIDAPEKDQTFGKQARDSLQEMVGKKTVQIDSQAVDQYGRIVGLISVDGRNVNQEQLQRGMAWEYSHYHTDKTYIGLQNDAQRSQRGLWGQGTQQAPWEWRRGHVTGEAGRLREPPPAARSPGNELQPGDSGQRKLHPSMKLPPLSKQHSASAPAAPKVMYDAACDKKRLCSQMSSCDEARFYLTHCGVHTLDRNKDGVPCESLCSGKR
jgi:endonuclease YncB( thermonuclease family)